MKTQTILREIYETYSNTKYSNFMKLSVISDINDRKFPVLLDIYNIFWEFGDSGSRDFMEIESQRIESLINDESIEKEELYILGLFYEYCFFNFFGRLIDEYSSYQSFKTISKILKKIKKLYIKAGSKGGIIEARDKFFLLAQNEYDQKLDILDIVEDDDEWKSIMKFIGKSYENIYNHSKICKTDADY